MSTWSRDVWYLLEWFGVDNNYRIELPGFLGPEKYRIRNPNKSNGPTFGGKRLTSTEYIEMALTPAFRVAKLSPFLLTSG